jgi:hypothetical protein
MIDMAGVVAHTDHARLWWVVAYNWLGVALWVVRGEWDR